MGRKLAMKHVRECMTDSFRRGELIDAQNLNCFLGALEELTDEEYRLLADEEHSGAIV